VRQDTKEFHALSCNDLPFWANLALETNTGSIIKLELESRINENPIFQMDLLESRINLGLALMDVI